MGLRSPMATIVKRNFLLLAATFSLFLGLAGESMAAVHKSAHAPRKNQRVRTVTVPPKVDAKAIANDIQPFMADLDRWIDQIEDAGEVSGLSLIHI